MHLTILLLCIRRMDHDALEQNGVEDIITGQKATVDGGGLQYPAKPAAFSVLMHNPGLT